MKIDRNIFKVVYSRGTGNGGQNKNKVETCVTITHIESGISEKCEDQRTRGQNEKIAYERLTKRLQLIIKKAKLEELNKKRRESIEKAGRIRSYNAQRNEVKDHRTDKVAPMDKVLNGDIDLLK